MTTARTSGSRELGGEVELLDIHQEYGWGGCPTFLSSLRPTSGSQGWAKKTLLPMRSTGQGAPLAHKQDSRGQRGILARLPQVKLTGPWQQVSWWWWRPRVTLPVTAHLSVRYAAAVLGSPFTVLRRFPSSLLYPVPYLLSSMLPSLTLVIDILQELLRKNAWKWNFCCCWC